MTAHPASAVATTTSAMTSTAAAVTSAAAAAGSSCDDWRGNSKKGRHARAN
jgi:hypothetical protein